MSSYAGKDFGYSDVVCPYFIRRSGRSIHCEGCVNRYATAHVFKTMQSLERHMDARCRTHEYGGCPYAHMKNLVYGV